MTAFNKIAAIALTSLTLAASAATSAEAANGRRAALGLGLLAGAVIGASALFNSPARAVPVYRGQYVPDDGCVRKTVGYTWDGIPVRRTVCY